MSKVKYDIKKVPRELLEEYILTRTSVLGSPSDISITNPVAENIRSAAFVPLRTRAEVDADIAKAVREYAQQAYYYPDKDKTVGLGFDGRFDYNGKRLYLCDVLNPLVLEETSD